MRGSQVRFLPGSPCCHSHPQSTTIHADEHGLSVFIASDDPDIRGCLDLLLLNENGSPVRQHFADAFITSVASYLIPMTAFAPSSAACCSIRSKACSRVCSHRLVNRVIFPPTKVCKRGAHRANDGPRAHDDTAHQSQIADNAVAIQGEGCGHHVVRDGDSANGRCGGWLIGCSWDDFEAA